MAQVMKSGPAIAQAGPGAAPQAIVPNQPHITIQQPMPVRPTPGVLQPAPVPAVGVPAQMAPQPTAILQPPVPHAVATATASAVSASPVAPSCVETTNATGGDPQAATAEATIQNLANTKEKTPMCLINELARYNKVSLKINVLNHSVNINFKYSTCTCIINCLFSSTTLQYMLLFRLMFSSFFSDPTSVHIDR